MNKLTKKVARLVDEGKINLTNGFALARLPLEEQEQFIDEAVIASNFIDKINNHLFYHYNKESINHK